MSPSREPISAGWSPCISIEKMAWSRGCSRERNAEAVANDIRWQPGDFGYFDINGTKSWAKKWAKYSGQLEAAAAAQQALLTWLTHKA